MPRPDKRSSLTLLTNERLRELAEELELSLKSGMRHDELVELLASSKRASFETVLGVLKRAELKEICHAEFIDRVFADEELLRFIRTRVLDDISARLTGTSSKSARPDHS
jgi:predicted DNA-binding transcriptional regulator